MAEWQSQFHLSLHQPPLHETCWQYPIKEYEFITNFDVIAKSIFHWFICFLIRHGWSPSLISIQNHIKANPTWQPQLKHEKTRDSRVEPRMLCGSLSFGCPSASKLSHPRPSSEGSLLSTGASWQGSPCCCGWWDNHIKLSRWWQLSTAQAHLKTQ